MFQIQKITTFFLFLLLVYFKTNAQSNVQFTRADTLKEINDTLLANKAAILVNERHAPFYLIPYCFAHKNKFRFNLETLDKLLEAYKFTRRMNDVQKRHDTELDVVFDNLDEHQRNILFWLTCTDIYKERPDYDYYKIFNVKDYYERK